MCQNSCGFFDHESGFCGVFDGVDTTNPITYKQCPTKSPTVDASLNEHTILDLEDQQQGESTVGFDYNFRVSILFLIIDILTSSQLISRKEKMPIGLKLQTSNLVAGLLTILNN